MRQLFLLTSMNGTTIDEERSASICSIRTRQSFVNASLGNISNIEGKRRSCTDDIALWPLFQCDISKKQNNYDLLAHISWKMFHVVEVDTFIQNEQSQCAESCRLLYSILLSLRIGLNAPPNRGLHRQIAVALSRIFWHNIPLRDNNSSVNIIAAT